MLEPHEIALARQPIFDRNDQLFGYELLYREDPSHLHAVEPPGGGPQMSGDTIIGSVLTLGMGRVTGGRRAFVNVDRATLLNGSAFVLDPSDVVLEIVETTGWDAPVVEACEALVAKGYSLALDDFVYDARYDPLLRIAQIVKLDVLDRPTDTLQRELDRIRPFGVRCLAERVETHRAHAQCAHLGFDLFQGYFFARPETLSGREVRVEQANLIRLLNLLRDPTRSDAQLEDVFRGDVNLTYKLLRIVNSAGTGHRGITSIGHAIRLLGRAALHRWMALLLVSSLCGPQHDTRGELVEMAMVRARFCELLSERQGRLRESGSSFVTGLFSLLDAMMHISMSELLERVELAEELREALLARQGPFAPPLKVAEAYEGAQWPEMLTAAESLGVRLEDVPELYLRSVEWARECRRSVTT